MGLSCERTQRLGTLPRLQSKRRSNASKVRVWYLMGFQSGLRPVCATICVASIKPIHADLRSSGIFCGHGWLTAINITLKRLHYWSLCRETEPNLRWPGLAGFGSR